VRRLPADGGSRARVAAPVTPAEWGRLALIVLAGVIVLAVASGARWA